MKTLNILISGCMILLTTITTAQNTQAAVKDADDTIVYTFAETFPVLLSGQSIRDYVKSNTLYPEKERADKKEGTVYITFIIEKDGSISHAEILKSVPNITVEAFNKEAIRVITTMPRCKPGTISGKALRIQMTEPVTFVIGPGSGDNEIHADTVKDPSYVQPGNQARTTSTEDDSVYTVAPVMPVFKGNFQSFLSNNLHYPVIEKEAGKQGMVYISFIIEKDGSVSNLEVVKDVPGAPGLTKEAIRVLSLMPQWSPAMLDGKPVRLRMVQRVGFKLAPAESGKEKR